MDLISTKEAYGYETIADAEYAEGLNDGLSQGLSQGKTEGELHKARELAKGLASLFLSMICVLRHDFFHCLTAHFSTSQTLIILQVHSPAIGYRAHKTPR